jgi:hypothetical protein
MRDKRGKAMARTPDVKARTTGKDLETRLESRTLSPVEERAIRMLRGLTVRPQAPLARIAEDGSELADELLLLELKLHKQMRGRAGRGVSATKSKIVRALRKKG